MVAEADVVYLSPIMNLYEAIGLSAFFLLLSSFVSPSEEDREAKLERQNDLGTYNVGLSDHLISILADADSGHGLWSSSSQS